MDFSLELELRVGSVVFMQDSHCCAHWLIQDAPWRQTKIALTFSVAHLLPIYIHFYSGEASHLNRAAEPMTMFTWMFL